MSLCFTYFIDVVCNFVPTDACIVVVVGGGAIAVVVVDVVCIVTLANFSAAHKS